MRTWIMRYSVMRKGEVAYRSNLRYRASSHLKAMQIGCRWLESGGLAFKARITSLHADEDSWSEFSPADVAESFRVVGLGDA